MSLAPTTTTTSSNRRRALAARRGSAAIAVAAIGIAATAGAAHGAFSRTRTSAVNTIAAASMESAQDLTATLSGETVTISWDAAKYSDNTSIEHYMVRRHAVDGSASADICSTPVTRRTCTDKPGVGTWQYTVTPFNGAWTGPVSNSNKIHIAPVVTDTTPPTAFAIESFRGNGAPSDAGRPSDGDKIIYTFSEGMDPESIKAGWDGGQVNVTVLFIDAPSRDDLTIDSVKLGTLDLGSGAYVKSNVKDPIPYGARMTMTTSDDGKSIVTVTLNGPVAALSAETKETTWRWTPDTAATDLAGLPTSRAVIPQKTAKHF